MDQVLTHFCSNPACQLHEVMVTEACSNIERPGEKHDRFAYGGGIALCDVCHSAVQVLAEKFRDEAYVEPPELWTPDKQIVSGLGIIRA